MKPRGPLVVFSYHFAPEVRVGGKRWAFLSRELIDRHFDVRVFTREMAAGEERDESLPSIPNITRCGPAGVPQAQGLGPVGRVLNRLLYQVVEPWGLEYGWAEPARRAAERNVPREPRGVVVGTLPPPAAAFAAAKFARQRGWPLILDYRDPWSGYGWKHKLKGNYIRSKARALERSIVEQSLARVFTTPEMEREFLKVFPEARPDQHFVIPNGFDLDETLRSDGAAIVSGNDIVYAGEFYGQRSLLHLLRALARVRDNTRELSNAKLVVYGVVNQHEMSAVEGEGLKPLLEVRTRIPRDRLIAVLRQAAALLVMPSAEMNYSMPYKLYDYLSVGRPILAVAPKGAALERFVKQYGVGTLADASSEDSIEKAIRESLLARIVPDAREAVAAHRWTKLADDYVRVIDTVV